MKAEATSVQTIVIDDSAPVRARVIALLREQGAEVVGEAGDGEAALELARTLRPAVVFLDLHMPKLSGLAVLPLLKAMVPCPIVVVLTNHPLEHYRAECTKHGADYFVDKSTDIDSAVREVIVRATRSP